MDAKRAQEIKSNRCRIFRTSLLFFLRKLSASSTRACKCLRSFFENLIFRRASRYAASMLRTHIHTRALARAICKFYHNARCLINRLFVDAYLSMIAPLARVIYANCRSRSSMTVISTRTQATTLLLITRVRVYALCDVG